MLNNIHLNSKPNYLYYVKQNFNLFENEYCVKNRFCNWDLFWIFEMLKN